MIYHGVTGAIASLHTPGFPDIGAEGWYLDLIRPIEVALSNSFGFGGTNGSLVFRRFDA